MNDISVEHISQILQGKKIAIVCGGGIAAIEMPRVARELRRHGANVQFFVTQRCLDFVGVTSLEWSSQSPAITDASGLSEHICTSDAVLVSPATANLISSVRHGLCQNSATTLIQSALGQNVPVIFVPTMHNSMFNSPIIQDNSNFLKSLKNVFFITPRQEENKAKILPPEHLALTVAHYINQYQNAPNRSVLISVGSTRAMIDPVRCLSNLSTGKLGWETVKLFYGMGLNVTAIVGQTEFETYQYQDLNLLKFLNYEEIYECFKNLETRSIDGFFHFLAGIDYTPESVSNAKLDSSKDTLTLKLTQTKKIRTLENLRNIPYKFFCKLTSGDDQDTKENVVKFFKNSNANTLLWNTAQGAWNTDNTHHGNIVTKSNKKIIFKPVSGKQNISHVIYDEYAKHMVKDA